MDTPLRIEFLEARLIEILAKAMNVSEDQCHVFFHQDVPRKQREGHMVYARIDSGFFLTDTEGVVAQKATDAVARALYEGFGRKYKVEVFPFALDGRFKTYLKPQPRTNVPSDI